MAVFSFEGREPRFPAEGQFWIAPDAVLIGSVRLAHDVGIWFGAVLRADDESISIGAGSNIQDNCVIHADPHYPVTIGEYCTIGHSAIVHGCTVGDNTLIGMGASILNGARVGRNCLVAANALIGEGKTIPDNCLVRGVPGIVAGELDSDKIRAVRKTAEDYIVWWRRYRSIARVDGAVGSR